MKSERRHELQTNYLADHLGTAVQTSKPYAVYVVGALAAVIVLAIGYGLYSTVAARANAAAWGEYYFNIGTGDSEAIQQLAQDHPGTGAANWSLQSWADKQLLEGLDLLYSNRTKAEETIKSAIEAYQNVLKVAYDQDLKSRAAMGLGQAHEALGNIEEASRHYKQVVSTSQDGFASMASSRLAWITSGEGKSFYEWFAKARSTTTPPPSIPGNLSQPPTSPSIEFPQKQNPLTLPSAGSEGAPATPPEPGTTVDPAKTAPLPTVPADTPAPATSTPATPAPGGLQIELPATPGTTAPAATGTPASEAATAEPAAPAKEDKPAETAPPALPPK